MNFPGMPSNEIPRSRARTAFVLGGAGIGWRADKLLDSGLVRGDRHQNIVHDAEHVYFAVALCQLLGLVGAAVGFYLISTAGGAEGASDAVHNIIAGLGAGLVATITGVLCSVVLAIEHHTLVHALER